MKKIWLLILTMLTLCLTGCRKDTTQIAKDEFSKYYNGNNEVVLCHWDNLYFENHTLKRAKLQPENLIGSIIFYDDYIYYLSLKSSNMGFKNDFINVYSCDYYGENAKLVFSKKLDIYSKVSIETNKDSYYIQYKKNNTILVDKYTISTNIYENIASGKDCSLSDYFQKEEESRYNVEVIENKSPKEHGKFIITDSETGLEKTIDDDYLKNTIYIESMEIFNYGPERFDISKGHILLTYGIGAGDGWNNPHLVFEYDFDLNTLDYKLLAFPEEKTGVEIIYIGE